MGVESGWGGPFPLSISYPFSGLEHDWSMSLDDVDAGSQLKDLKVKRISESWFHNYLTSLLESLDQ